MLAKLLKMILFHGEHTIATILLMEVIKSYLKLYVAERLLVQTVAAAEHCDLGALAEQQRNVGTI